MYSAIIALEKPLALFSLIPFVLVEKGIIFDFHLEYNMYIIIAYI